MSATRRPGGNPVVWTCLAVLALIRPGAAAEGAGGASIRVEPAVVALRGSDDRAQVVVTGFGGDGPLVDLTGSALYESRDRRVAEVEPGGRVRPVGDGRTTVEVSAGAGRATVEVVVADFADARPVRFAGEVAPLLSKLGCNAGACHGKATGQEGFRLSLLGSDPGADREALAVEGRGRRVFPAAPGVSLLLRKPTAEVPHGGGKRLSAGSPEYRTLARWIAQGAPSGAEPSLVRVAVEPARRVVARLGRQQLRVVAHFDDGSARDVTRLARYQSNAADLAEVDPDGLVRAPGGVGEAAIMARFGGLVGVAVATIPSGGAAPIWDDPPSNNLIDPFVARKLRALGLAPSEACTDAEFARRSSLDLCGVLPNPAEVVAFERDDDPGKRARWVDRQLDRPEYADQFALKWSAILENKRTLGDPSKPGTFAFHAWIRQALAENRPYDQFVAEILAARGDPDVNPAVAWSNRPASPEDRADDAAQLFLGLRIACARCHHHPTERWGQDDHAGFASIFARIGLKPGPDPTSPRVFNLPGGLAVNASTGEPCRPKPPGAPDFGDLGPDRDPRAELVAWLRRPDNPFFARAVVNRSWKHLLGRGLVEPEDDLRASNPPSDPELLDALAADFVAHGFDLKRLIRTIATSLAYDRSSQPTPRDEADRRNFARFSARRLPAEVLLDAIGVVTGSPEAFPGLPEGTRAVQLPDDGFASPFLDAFGRPARETPCECERSAEANLSQTLLLLTSDAVHRKLTPDAARAATLAADPRPVVEKVEGLYRLALARRPTDEERSECVAFLARRPGRPGYEDLIWALINTKEFLFNH